MEKEQTNKEEQYVQYYVINQELEMSTGKIASQTAHAAILTALKYNNEHNFQKWLETNQTKIILRGKEKDLKKLEERGFIAVYDLGNTEVPPNSLTLVASMPMKRKYAKKEVKRLQLFKK